MPPYASGQRTEMIGGWYMHLLPYLGHQDVYDRLAAGQRSQHGNSHVVSNGRWLPGVKGVIFPELLCPSDLTHITTNDAPTNYLANWYALSDDQAGMYRPAQRFDPPPAR